MITVVFADPDAVQFGAEEEFWTDITINQEKAPLRDVLNYVMTEFAVEDIRVVEISMENIVQKIYDGGF